MTIFFPDISSYQTGFPLTGIPAIVVKATEGIGYVNPDYSRVVHEAQARGLLQVSYHFLRRSNAANQANFALSVIGAGVPTMLDVEPSSDGVGPTMRDVFDFMTQYRALGGVLHLAYLPRWYWRDLGSPDLTPLEANGLHVVSSLYTTYSDDGPGWAAYGGVAPVIWQFTDSYRLNGYTVDLNAYRGTVDELRTLVTGGEGMALDPSDRQLLETAGGAVVFGGTSMGPPVPSQYRIFDDPALQPDATGRYGNSEVDLLQYIRRLVEDLASRQAAGSTLTDDQISAIGDQAAATIIRGHDGLTEDDIPLIRAAIEEAIRNVLG